MRTRNVIFKGDNILTSGTDVDYVYDRRLLAEEIEKAVDNQDYDRLRRLVDEFGGDGNAAAEVACRIGKIYWSHGYRARVSEVIKRSAIDRIGQREQRRWQVEGSISK